MVEEGKPAPDFELESDAGEKVRLLRLCAASRSSSTSIPRTTRLAARPRPAASATPTASSSAQAPSCSGSRPTSVDSHVKFKTKYELPFTLLADADQEVAEAYGVWGEKTNYGRKYFGIMRSTFVIGPDGIVKKVFPKVSSPRRTPTTCWQRSPSLGARRLSCFGARLA